MNRVRNDLQSGAMMANVVPLVVPARRRRGRPARAVFAFQFTTREDVSLAEARRLAAAHIQRGDWAEVHFARWNVRHFEVKPVGVRAFRVRVHPRFPPPHANE